MDASFNSVRQILLLSVLFFNVLFIFERQSTSRGRAEREGDTEPEAGSGLWAVSTEPDTGLELINHEIMTWAEVGHVTHWDTQVPLFIPFKGDFKCLTFVKAFGSTENLPLTLSLLFKRAYHRWENIASGRGSLLQPRQGSGVGTGSPQVPVSLFQSEVCPCDWSSSQKQSFLF